MKYGETKSSSMARTIKGKTQTKVGGALLWAEFGPGRRNRSNGDVREAVDVPR